VKVHALAADVARGVSPAAQKRLEKLRGPDSDNPTVREFCDRYLREQVDGRLKRPDNVRAYIERDICPALGKKLLKDVKLPDVRNMIHRHSKLGHVRTALYLRSSLKGIFDYAIELQLVDGNPARDVAPKYLGETKARTRALNPKELRVFLRTLDLAAINPQLRLALRMILLTLVRKSELLQARWSDVNLDAGIWAIAAAHTKTGKEHIVYLSTQVAEMFRELQVLACGSEFVLPGRNSIGRPICVSTLNAALDQIDFGIPSFHIHDMRRTGSTILHDKGFPSDAIELCLGHAIGGVKGIYNRASYAAERRKMLQWWSDYIDNLVNESNVLVGNFGA
jgi:integrase